MVEPTESLPAGLVAYKRTALFDQHNMPAGLRRAHTTKAGVWGKIHVAEGRLLYRVLDPVSEQLLTPDRPGIVQPEQRHEVEPLGAVKFFVEFYKGGP